MASTMIVPPSKHTLFMRGFSSRHDVEEIRQFFIKEAGNTSCTVEFLKESDNRDKIFIALRFESKDIAKDILNRFDNTDVFGDRVTITWFKDLRRARIRENDQRRAANRRGWSPLRNGFRPWNSRTRTNSGGERETRRDSRRHSRGHKDRSSSRSYSRSHSRSQSRGRSSGESSDRERSRSPSTSRERKSPTPPAKEDKKKLLQQPPHSLQKSVVDTKEKRDRSKSKGGSREPSPESHKSERSRSRHSESRSVDVGSEGGSKAERKIVQREVSPPQSSKKSQDKGADASQWDTYKSPYADHDGERGSDKHDDQPKSTPDRTGKAVQSRGDISGGVEERQSDRASERDWEQLSDRNPKEKRYGGGGGGMEGDFVVSKRGKVVERYREEPEVDFSPERYYPGPPVPQYKNSRRLPPGGRGYKNRPIVQDPEGYDYEEDSNPEMEREFEYFDERDLEDYRGGRYPQEARTRGRAPPPKNRRDYQADRDYDDVDDDDDQYIDYQRAEAERSNLRPKKRELMRSRPPPPEMTAGRKRASLEAKNERRAAAMEMDREYDAPPMESKRRRYEDEVIASPMSPGERDYADEYPPPARQAYPEERMERARLAPLSTGTKKGKVLPPRGRKGEGDADFSRSLSRDVDREVMGVPSEKMALVKQKKEEIEKAYRQDCETFSSVVKMLISKDPELENHLQQTLKDNLKEIGQRCIYELREYIAEIKADDDSMHR